MSRSKTSPKIPRPRVATEVRLKYLDDLKVAGAVNMYAAAPFLANAFGITLPASRKVLSYWKATYTIRHPKKSPKTEDSYSGPKRLVLGTGLKKIIDYAEDDQSLQGVFSAPPTLQAHCVLCDPSEVTREMIQVATGPFFWKGKETLLYRCTQCNNLYAWFFQETEPVNFVQLLQGFQSYTTHPQL